MKNNYENQIARIIYMETLYDEICAALQKTQDPAAEREVLDEKIRELEAYYQGSEWMEDHDADQEGKIPRDLKRGVLAEDTIYDLLCDLGR